MAVQEHHDFADDFLFSPGRFDFLPSFGSDAIHRFEFCGTLLNDFEDPLPKFADEFLGIDRADAFDHAAPKIFFDTFDRGGRRAGEHLRFELEAEFPVPNPDTLRRYPLARADARKRANDGHKVAMPLGFYFENCKAVFLIEERDAFDQADEAFDIIWIVWHGLQRAIIVVAWGLAGKTHRFMQWIRTRLITSAGLTSTSNYLFSVGKNTVI